MPHPPAGNFTPSSRGIVPAAATGKPRRKKPRCCAYEEVSSVEWEAIAMTQQEEDIIYRMYRLVGDRWDLIAGRIPGRKPEDIERFWIMRYKQMSVPIHQAKNEGF